MVEFQVMWQVLHEKRKSEKIKWNNYAWELKQEIWHFSSLTVPLFLPNLSTNVLSELRDLFWLVSHFIAILTLFTGVGMEVIGQGQLYTYG